MEYWNKNRKEDMEAQLGAVEAGETAVRPAASGALDGSFSAVSKPIFATRCSIFRD